MSDARQAEITALEAIKKLKDRIRALIEERASSPIAVVGLSCRFPGGVTDPDEFWKALREGTDLRE